MSLFLWMKCLFVQRLFLVLSINKKCWLLKRLLKRRVKKRRSRKSLFLVAWWLPFIRVKEDEQQGKKFWWWIKFLLSEELTTMMKDFFSIETKNKKKGLKFKKKYKENNKSSQVNKFGLFFLEGLWPRTGFDHEAFYQFFLLLFF